MAHPPLTPNSADLRQATLPLCLPEADVGTDVLPTRRSRQETVSERALALCPGRSQDLIATRMKHEGTAALRLPELLAVLLRQGRSEEDALRLADRLLANRNGLADLCAASMAELVAEGLSEASAGLLLAALELSKRLLTPEGERVQIKSPAAAAALLMPAFAGLDQEHLKVILLNTKNHVLDTPTVYIGTVDSAHIRVAEIFKPAIRRNCPSLIVAHNHPSGEISPSPEDIQVTRNLVKAGKLLDIEVQDHLIIGAGRFFSLRERHLGF